MPELAKVGADVAALDRIPTPPFNLKAWPELDIRPRLHPRPPVLRTRPHIKRQSVGEFTINTYLEGAQAIIEDEDTFTELAKCYCEVFNESWGENWTVESAKRTIRADLAPQGARKPIAALLYREGRIVGFYWGAMTKADDINENTDMPFDLPLSDRATGTQIAKYWLENIVKKKEIFLSREIGILKPFRRNLFPYLSLSAYEAVYNLGYNTYFYWTNIHSKIFSWGLGIEGYPIHYFLKDDLVLIGGRIKTVIDNLYTIVKPNSKREGYRLLTNNINRYLCR